MLVVDGVLDKFIAGQPRPVSESRSISHSSLVAARRLNVQCTMYNLQTILQLRGAVRAVHRDTDHSFGRLLASIVRVSAFSACNYAAPWLMVDNKLRSFLYKSWNSSTPPCERWK